MPKFKLPDVDHGGTGTWSRHKGEYSDMCPICGPKLERTKRITAFHKSLVDFGYATLTRDDVAEAYDLAADSRHDLQPEDSIIVRLIRTQLQEAGLF